MVPVDRLTLDFRRDSKFGDSEPGVKTRSAGTKFRSTTETKFSSDPDSDPNFKNRSQDSNFKNRPPDSNFKNRSVLSEGLIPFFLQVLTGFCDLVLLRTILRLPLGRVPKYMRRYKIDTDTKSRAILVYRKVLFRREDDSLNKHQFVQPSYNKP